MTTYILHGGFTKVQNELNTNFYKEIVRLTPDGGTILLICFARGDAEYKKACVELADRIAKYKGEKKLTTICANYDNFMGQVRGADVLYLDGGDTNELLTILKKYPEITNPDTLANKTIAGSSASALVLAKYYHSSSYGGIHEGLGILPIRIICHYKSPEFDNKDDPLTLMQEHPNNLELVILKDYEWKVIHT
jgi:peptidase E